MLKEQSAELRQARKWTELDLGEKIHLSADVIRLLERDESALDPQTLAYIRTWFRILEGFTPTTSFGMALDELRKMDRHSPRGELHNYNTLIDIIELFLLSVVEADRSFFPSEKRWLARAIADLYSKQIGICISAVGNILNPPDNWSTQPVDNTLIFNDFKKSVEWLKLRGFHGRNDVSELPSELQLVLRIVARDDPGT